MTDISWATYPTRKKESIVPLYGNHVLLTTNYPIEKMFRWRNEYSIYKWSRQQSPLIYNDHKKWVDGLSGNSKEKYFVIEEIEEIGSPIPVGICGLSNIDWIARHAEFSIYLEPSAQRRGFGTEALSLLIAHGFNEFGLNKIWGESFNTRAMAMFQAVGMTISEGHRQHYFKEGKWLDSQFASITYKEFLEKTK